MSPADRPVRVLVADDSELFRELLSGVVAADPAFEVVAVAADGDRAAALARQLKPDVITMDLNMPDADGFSGIARIMAETPTPILVLTASPTARNSPAATANTYLKPITGARVPPIIGPNPAPSEFALCAMP